MSEFNREKASLKRSLGLPMIFFYGVGTIVGGGFYALTGKVVAEAGMLAPLAFLFAAGLALLSAFSFAELSARYPVSAGEAHYVREAFQRPWLSAVVGWMVVATGVVSAATLATAFAGFLHAFIPIPNWIAVTGMVISLGLITAWGIDQSATLALVITVVEVGGLLAVLLVAGNSFGEIPNRWRELIPSLAIAEFSGIFFGAYLAFYAFIGFEDMVNVAEEVKQPEKNLPIAILASVLVTGLLYFFVSLACVLSVPQAELIASESPLTVVMEGVKFGPVALAVIGMLAGLNGALVQIVMASRVCYGLAQKGLAPSLFNRISQRTSTPLEATVVVTIIVLCLALWLPLVLLATVTSTILLLVYAVVNFSLWRIKGRGEKPPTGAPNFPRWLALFGGLACCVFLLIRCAAFLL